MSTLRLYIAHHAEDDRWLAMLARHLQASLPAPITLLSRQTAPIGSTTPLAELRKEQLLRADVLVILVSTWLLQDSFFNEVELPWILARHHAGALVAVVACAPTSLRGAIATLPTLAPDTYLTSNDDLFFHTCAETIATRLANHVDAGPSANNTEHGSLSNELFRIYLRRHLDGSDNRERAREIHRHLRSDGNLHPGDVLGGRFQLRRRALARPEREEWLAFDLRDMGPAVVHALRRGTPDMEATLRRRLATRAQLRHPALASILAALQVESDLDRAFFATEPTGSETLASLVHRGRLQPAAWIEKVVPVGQALAEAHASGVVHGQVCPEMIAMARDLDETPHAVPLKLRWPQSDLGDRPPSDDVVGLARTLAYCLYGSAFSPDVSAQELREIVGGQSDFDQLRALLVAHVAPSRCIMDMAGFVRAVRDALRLGQQRSGSPQRADLAMARIRGASFYLGARPDDVWAKPRERPQRLVRVEGFAMGVYPVSQRLYFSVMEENPSAIQGDCLPVHNVTLREAALFCNRLSELHGYAPTYSVRDDDLTWSHEADGYRLPTEAEWELCAKGVEERLYPWGDIEPRDRVCWRGPGNVVGVLSRKGPSAIWNHPEGQSPDGVHDLGGNVWEWSWDSYSPFGAWLLPHSKPLVNPVGPRRAMWPESGAAVEGGDYRVLRGGAWNVERPELLRCTARSMDLASKRDPDIGFRLARGPRTEVTYLDTDAHWTRHPVPALPAEALASSGTFEVSAEARARLLGAG